MEGKGENHVLELTSVAGVLFVMIDNQRYCYGFKNHIKVWLELNDISGTSDYSKGIRKDVHRGVNDGVLGGGNGRSEFVDFENRFSNSSSPRDLPESGTRSSAVENYGDFEKPLCHMGHVKKDFKRLKKNKSENKTSDLTLTDAICSGPIAKDKCQVFTNSFDEKRELAIGGDESFSGKAKEKMKKSETIKNLFCEYCLKHFDSQRDFYNHRKSKREEHSCEICQKAFPFKAHLQVHTLLSHGGVKEDAGTNRTKLTCRLCGALMSNSTTFKTHMMQHTGENAYQCCVCSKSFTSIGRFSYHLGTHRRVGNVFCKICKLGFESRTDLSRHQLTHIYRCSLCNAVFPNKTSRSFHYKLSHAGDILKCPQCDKLYSSESELQIHMKYHQSRQKTQCTICGRLVSRLEDHMLSHEAEADYVCDQCPKQFKSKISFQRHMRTHSGERLYSCTLCAKSFGRSNGLSRHMIIHTQQKPHICSICGKACSQKYNLKAHMQIHKESAGSESMTMTAAPPE